METGVLAEWYIQEGSSFAAGEAIAKIETDKASIDFEAQDDGFVAKILMEAGTGADIKVGTAIMVTVEEAEHIGAFANFTAPAEVPALTPAPAASTPSPTAAAPPSVPPAPPAPAVVVVAAAAAPPPPPPAATKVVVAPPEALAPTVQAMAAAVAPVMSTGWGEFAKINSPLIKTLSQAQKDYIAKYGTTGQIPL
jgi:pyruvate dehydrogenase E2 component (dihydrolipoamide acetyltransferase)